ncbi:acyl carrier protein [Paenibacillus silagei]|uniref:Acyl carrier protein n=1 Tax=Paenibacillus silagei TaxID=1670801 RepID=A0ABS4NM38_9BACL|nr:acyl carrier protein [Paenibacillus silagei]MBP2111128.1 acyl carrier protein [Paenibacillus silagei]
MDITFETIHSALLEALDVAVLPSLADRNRDLTEVGLDSIGFIRFIVTLEAELGVEIPEEYILLARMNTLNKVMQVLSTVK